MNIKQPLQKLESSTIYKDHSLNFQNIARYDFLTYLSLKESINKAYKKIKKEGPFKIIDVGCGQKPYEQLFKPTAKSYTGVDLDNTADVIADVQDLPFKNGSFALALCFQVLEHVENPQKVVDEIYRVLNKDGRTILTTHGIWYFHPGPHDYHRWTHEGLEKLFDKFSEVKVWPTIKSYSTVIQLINIELYTLSARNILLKIPLYFCILALNIIGKILLSRGNNHMTINYLVLAKK